MTEELKSDSIKVSAALLVLAAIYYATNIIGLILFWFTLTLTRLNGAIVGNYPDRPVTRWG